MPDYEKPTVKQAAKTVFTYEEGRDNYTVQLAKEKSANIALSVFGKFLALAAWIPCAIVTWALIFKTDVEFVVRYYAPLAYLWCILFGIGTAGFISGFYGSYNQGKED